MFVTWAAAGVPLDIYMYQPTCPYSMCGCPHLAGPLQEQGNGQNQAHRRAQVQECPKLLLERHCGVQGTGPPVPSATNRHRAAGAGPCNTIDNRHRAAGAGPCSTSDNQQMRHPPSGQAAIPLVGYNLLGKDNQAQPSHPPSPSHSPPRMHGTQSAMLAPLNRSHSHRGSDITGSPKPVLLQASSQAASMPPHLAQFKWCGASIAQPGAAVFKKKARERRSTSMVAVSSCAGHVWLSAATDGGPDH